MAELDRRRIRERGMAAGMAPNMDLEAIARRGMSAFEAPGASAGAGEAAAVGGLAGVGMGAVFGGPVGLALGGLTGVLSYLGSQREAAQLAEWQGTLSQVDEETTRAIDRAFDRAETQSDRDQVEARNTNWQNTKRVIGALGPAQGSQLLASLAQSGMLDGGARAEISEMESRQQKLDDDTLAANRQVVQDHRRYLRGRADTLFRDQLAVERNMEQARILLDDPNVDIDHPAAQAELGKLLEQTKRNMLANAEDMTDAMRGVGGTGLLGTGAAILSLAFGAEKAEEMRISREQWRQLLAANEIVARKQNMREREALYAEADEHVQRSAELGMPADELTTILSRFRGLESEADRPTMPPPGGFPVGVEGPKRPTNGNPVRGLLNRTQDRLRETDPRRREAERQAELAAERERERQAQQERFRRQREREQAWIDQARGR